MHWYNLSQKLLTVPTLPTALQLLSLLLLSKSLNLLSPHILIYLEYQSSLWPSVWFLKGKIVISWYWCSLRLTNLTLLSLIFKSFEQSGSFLSEQFISKIVHGSTSPLLINHSVPQSLVLFHTFLHLLIKIFSSIQSYRWLNSASLHSESAPPSLA